VLRTLARVSFAALAAMCALAGCGPVRLGAAAIVGGQRISSATLTSQVSSLEDQYRASGGRIQLQFPLTRAPQQVLGWLVRFQIRDRLAARNHIAVSRGESQRALAALAAQVRQSGVPTPLRQLAVAVGLPPGLYPELGRYQAIQQAALNRLDGGTPPSSSAAQQALNSKFGHEECLAAKSLHIQINPQFGRMDYRQLAVIPSPATLSAPSAATPAPKPAPQLRPPC
jgi:SurA N-terminal domain